MSFCLNKLFQRTVYIEKENGRGIYYKAQRKKSMKIINKVIDLTAITAIIKA